MLPFLAIFYARVTIFQLKYDTYGANIPELSSLPVNLPLSRTSTPICAISPSVFGLFFPMSPPALGKLNGQN